MDPNFHKAYKEVVENNCEGIYNILEAIEKSKSKA